MHWHLEAVFSMIRLLSLHADGIAIHRLIKAARRPRIILHPETVVAAEEIYLQQPMSAAPTHSMKAAELSSMMGR